MQRRTPAASLAGLLALGATIVALVGPGAIAATNCTPDGSWGTNRADLAADVVAAVNAYRAGKGLSRLSSSSSLRASAEWKSLHMAANGYFSHDDPAPPVARSAFQRAADCGFGGSTWGENIAYGYGSPQAVMDGWIGSSGHRANLENPSFTTIGVGVAQRANGTLYWTQNFGNDGAPAAAPPPASPPPPPPSPPPAAAPQPAPAPAPSAPSPRPPADPAPASPPPGPVPVKPVAPPAVTRAGNSAVGAFRVRTNQPRAGKRLVASVEFVRVETGRRLSRGDVRCRAEIGSARLRVVVNAFVRGRATCAWAVPRGSAGRRVTGVVALQLGTRAAIRRFERTVAHAG